MGNVMELSASKPFPILMILFFVERLAGIDLYGFLMLGRNVELSHISQSFIPDCESGIPEYVSTMTIAMILLRIEKKSLKPIQARVLAYFL